MIDGKLESVQAYKSSAGVWWLKLVYSYEDGKGKHVAVFPKVNLPFEQRSVPEIRFPMSNGVGISEPPYIECRELSRLYKGTCDLAQIRGVTDVSEFFNIITEPAEPKEMTLSEIEAKLGYSIKIVNDKEENNGSCETM